MPDFPLLEQLDGAIDLMLGGLEQTEHADPTLAALTEIAGALRDLPADSYKTRLSEELKRSKPMTASVAAPPLTVPTFVIQGVTPLISVPEGSELIEFMKRTFDAEETARHPHGPGDGFVASVKIGTSDLLIMGGESVRGHERPMGLHVYVKDCDAVYRRALEAGAMTTPPGVGEPADRPYGERCAFVTDPYGNQWYIATKPGPDYVPAGLGHVTPYMHPAKASPLIDFLKTAFGAEEVARFEHDGRVMHAVVRLGKSTVEMGEANLPPVAFYMYTDDVDAVYHRALSAGAISLSPPADQPYGDRVAGLQDPFGNHWFPAKTHSRS